MKKEERKVKAFMKEHGKDIFNITVATGLVVCGGIMGWKLCYKNVSKNNIMLKRGTTIANTLIGMRADYPDTFASFTRTNLHEGFKVSELGKLGEVMMECGAPSDADLTHFICLGPATE